MKRAALLISGLMLLSLLVSSGCNRESDQIRVQSVPKLPPPVAAPSDAPMAADDVDPHAQPAAAAQSAPVQWTIPAGWKEQPGGQMRFATLLVNEDPKVELTVVPLAGDSGGLLANVVRWQGQLGLPPATEQELPKLVQHLEVSGHPVDVVDLLGPDNVNPRPRMLAAIAKHDGKSWYFKMTGPDAVVGKQKENFDALVKSLKFGSGETAAAAPTAAPAEAAKPHAADANASDVTYAAPDGWTKQDPKPMRVVSFTVGKAELIVSKFPSTGAGGYLDNVNRWRNQAGLPSVQQGDQQTSQKVNVGGAEGALFDLTGPEKRLLVAWIPRGQDWWFFKFAGPTDVVTQQQPAFERFLKSVQFVAGGADAAAGNKPQ